MKKTTKKTPPTLSSPPAAAVPKLIGADIELGNCVVGVNRPNGTGYLAARMLLREIPGAANPEDYDPGDDGEAPEVQADDDAYDVQEPCESAGGYAPGVTTYGQSGYNQGYGYGYGYGLGYDSEAARYNPQDWGRKWLRNGGCTYIDLGHLEGCMPEMLSAFDHVAGWHAMLRIVRGAQQRAQATLPQGQSLEVLVNNSDGQGNSYGSHTNFLVTRACWDNIFHHKLHHMLYLATYMTSSIVFTGSGKVGSENGQPDVDYQLAQRADFDETITGVQTTHNRPIVNSRDETLCGRTIWGTADAAARSDLARLHVIFFDNTLCHVSTLLKMGVTQIILAMIEQEQVDATLILDDPLTALHTWSHDPDCQAVARLIDGRQFSAVEIQQMFFDRAKAFVDAGRADGLVPRAGEILDLWGQTLAELRAWDVDALVGKLDHVLKRCILEDVISRRGLAWNSDEIRYLDQIYGSLKPSQGLYRLYENELVRKVVSSEVIERFVHEPPSDTRAYLRGHLVRRVNGEALTSMDWDTVRMKFADPDAKSTWLTQRRYVLPMADPLAFTEAQCGKVLAEDKPIVETLEALGMVESTGAARRAGGYYTTPQATTPGGGQVVLVRDVSRVGLYDNVNTHGNPNTKGGKNR